MAIDSYRAVGGQMTAEEEIAARVQQQVLPALRSEFKELADLQQVWIVNGIEAKVTAATMADEPLAGYSAADWATWGEVLRQLMTWLNTPIEALNDATPGQVLVKRYTVVQP